MDLRPVRTTPAEDFPWTKNSIYKYSAQGRFPEIIIKVGGKLFVDMDAFEELAIKSRDEQIKKSKNVRRSY